MNKEEYEKIIENLNNDATHLLELHKKDKEKIEKAIECINKKLNANSDYVDYDFGVELLRQELLEILKGESNE